MSFSFPFSFSRSLPLSVVLSRLLSIAHSVSLFPSVCHTPFHRSFFLLSVITLSLFFTSFFESERCSWNVALDTCLKLQGIITVYPDMLYDNDVRCLRPLVTECQTARKVIKYSFHTSCGYETDVEVTDANQWSSLHQQCTLSLAKRKLSSLFFISPLPPHFITLTFLAIHSRHRQKYFIHFTLSRELWAEHIRIFSIVRGAKGEYLQ
jgi:hypothetical protein